MAETLAQKALRLGIKPANAPVVSAPTETLLQKAQRLGIKPATPTTQQGKFSQAFQAMNKRTAIDPLEIAGNIKNDLQKRGANITETVKKSADETLKKSADELSPKTVFGKVKSYLRTGLRTTGNAAGGVVDILSDTISPFIEKIGDAAGDSKALQRSATSGTGAKILDAAERGQEKIKKLEEEHPEATKDIGAAGNILAILLGQKLDEPIKFRSKPTTVSLTERAPVGPEKPPTAEVKTPVAKKIATQEDINDPVFKKLLTESSRGNLHPQVQGSFNNLYGKGLDALSEYRKAADLTRRHLSDVKNPKAIEHLMETEGNAAIDETLAKKNKIGAMMGNELKKNGHIELDISDKINKFQEKLLDEANVKFENGKLVSTTKQSALTREEMNFANEYVRELQSLGSKPTVADLDAFKKRMTQELNVYKNKTPMTTSNIQRLVKGNLSDLGEAFHPERNPALGEYFTYKKDYGDIKNGLKQVLKTFGEKLPSGKYVRGSSVLKRGVQSLADGGSREALSFLEQHTGRQLLDKASLYLQASKDLGDVSASNLLDIFGKENGLSKIPTSRSEIVRTVLEKGRKAFLGTPEEQTIRVLKDAGKKINAFNKNKVIKMIEEEIYPKAKAAKDFIDETAKDIADKNGASVVTADLKKTQRMIDKSLRDGKGYVAHLNQQTDIARNTIVADEAKHSAIIEDLKKEGNVVGKPKKQTREEYYGYYGNRVLIKTPNGHIAEIQVLSPEMMVAKMNPKAAVEALGQRLFDVIVKESGVEPGLGHDYYVKWQNAVVDGNKSLILKAEQAMKDYNMHF